MGECNSQVGVSLEGFLVEEVSIVGGIGLVKADGIKFGHKEAARMKATRNLWFGFLTYLDICINITTYIPIYNCMPILLMGKPRHNQAVVGPVLCTV